MRARNIKPSIFKNELLARLGPWHFILFQGLWCLADREGRLEDRPDRIEAEIFPFKFQQVDIEKLLNDLQNDEKNSFILRYSKSKNRYIQITSFHKHQRPHPNEDKSTIPPLYLGRKHLQPRLEPHGLNPDVLNPLSPSLETSNTSCDLGAKSPTPSANGNCFGPENVMRIWNRLAHPGLPRVKLLPRTREAKIKARLQDFKTEADWRKIIERVNQSSFLTGQKTKWRVHFDWILNSENITKIMEGNYDDDIAGKSNAHH